MKKRPRREKGKVYPKLGISTDENGKVKRKKRQKKQKKSKVKQTSRRRVRGVRGRSNTGSGVSSHPNWKFPTPGEVRFNNPSASALLSAITADRKNFMELESKYRALRDVAFAPKRESIDARLIGPAPVPRVLPDIAELKKLPFTHKSPIQIKPLITRKEYGRTFVDESGDSGNLFQDGVIAGINRRRDAMEEEYEVKDDSIADIEAKDDAEEKNYSDFLDDDEEEVFRDYPDDPFEGLEVETDYLPKGGSKRASNMDWSKLKGRALDSDDIDKLMGVYPQYHGWCMADQVSKMLVPSKTPFGFIVNLDETGGPGSHWCALYVSPVEKTIEWYDSFADEIPEDILSQIEDYTSKKKHLYKLKENAVADQDESSKRCGWFACVFLMKRFRGIPFPKASKWDEEKAEAMEGFGFV